MGEASISVRADFLEDEFMARNFSRMMVLMLCALFLASCASIPQISVKERWNDSIRSYALIPIYPMVEQFYVGDLRLFTGNAGPYDLSSRYLGHVDSIGNALFKKEGRLPIFPKTSVAPSDANKTTAWPQPAEPILLRGSVTEPRLRMAALPSIALARLTGGELGGRGISGLWNWVVGGNARSEATLNISVSGVETLEIDDVTAYTLSNEYLKQQKESPAFREGLCAAATTLGDPNGTKSKIAVVTRVFYARGIKYVYGKTFDAALRAVAGEGDRPELPLEGIKSSDPATSGTAVEAEKPNLPAVDLSPLTSRTTPGLLGRFAAAKGDTLKLVEVFERPLAFGAAALLVSVSKLGIDCSEVEVTVIGTGPDDALAAPPDGDD